MPTSSYPRSKGAGSMSSTSDLVAEAKPPTGEARSAPSTTLMWAMLMVVLIADLLDLLDGTITNIAAPAIVADLGGGSALVKWLGASYALAMGTPVGGRRS